jgi:hypothetical protein
MADDHPGASDEFPGVIPHKRTPPTSEVPQMVICRRGNRIVIDVTYIGEAQAFQQMRGWTRARESGELRQLIDEKTWDD